MYSHNWIPNMIRQKNSLLLEKPRFIRRFKNILPEFIATNNSVIILNLSFAKIHLFLVKLFVRLLSDIFGNRFIHRSYLFSKCNNDIWITLAKWCVSISRPPNISNRKPNGNFGLSKQRTKCKLTWLDLTSFDYGNRFPVL